MSARLLAVCLLVLSLLGVVAYVVITYLFAYRYSDRRPWSVMLRDVLREAWWVSLTQPFLLLFYVLGRRLGSPGGSQPIVFVHGYAHNRVGFWWLARALRARGLGPFYAVNYPFVVGIASAATRLRDFIDDVRAETGCAAVDLVCHSMGGLVGMEMLRTEAGVSRVRRCVTIATPHAGVIWRGPIFGASGAQLRKDSVFLRALGGGRVPIPVLSIYSMYDNIVYPASTSALTSRGGRDVAVAAGGHLSLLFSTKVADAIHEFLLQADEALSAADPTAPAFIARTASEEHGHDASGIGARAANVDANA